MKDLLDVFRERTLLGKAVSWLATPDASEQLVFHDPFRQSGFEWVSSATPLMRTGEALNAKGTPFGSAVTSLACTFLSGSPLDESGLEALLCVGHSASGVSLLNLSYDAQKGWRHEISGDLNARITNVFSFSHSQCNELVLGGVCTVAALPWKNFVALDEEGFLLEIDSRQGIAYRYEDLGFIEADAIWVREPMRGRPFEIFCVAHATAEAAGRVWRFESEKRYDPSRPRDAIELLRSGKREELDAESAARVLAAKASSAIPFRFERLESGQSALLS